jgi:hypothetical protein
MKTSGGHGKLTKPSHLTKQTRGVHAVLAGTAKNNVLRSHAEAAAWRADAGARSDCHPTLRGVTSHEIEASYADVWRSIQQL